MNTIKEQEFDKFSKFTHEEIYDKLYELKRDLCWLDEDIALTRAQRELFYSIKNRLKTLLGC